MRNIFPALIGFAWTFGIALSAPSSAQQSLRIGVSLSITGKQYSVQGGYGREGYLLCQKDVNAQGGVLRRSIEFVIYDDGSDEKTAARNYEKLITEEKVDAVLGPYGSAITEAVADVTEKHRKLMIAPMAATTSIWEKGRRYLIMMLAPVEGLSEGLLDLAARNGLKTLAVIKLDGLVANAAANGASELAKTKGLQLVFSETYPNGTQFFRHSEQSEGDEAGRPYGRLDPARRPGGHHAPGEGTGSERQHVEQRPVWAATRLL
jgi:branched-chain amino acid transport system substrate-binding protein